MKIGFHTIVWWPFKDELDYIFEVIAAAGFKGVEFRHLPDQLGKIGSLLKLLDKYNLELIGLSGGSLEERKNFCEHSFRPKYLHTNEWSEEIAKLATTGKNPFTIALHPRIFKPVRGIKDAQEIFKKDPNLKFLPDIAHLTITGDNPVEVIKTYKDRIVGVHFKDWTSEFGHSVHRYARGFVELGEGEVDLGGVLRTLRDIDYNGWLIVEQDWTRTDPAISTFRAAKWLAGKGLLPAPPAKIPERKQKRVGVNSIYEEYHLGGGAEAHFLEKVVSAGWQDVQSCYESIARAFVELCSCELVGLWTCSPANKLMDLVAVYPDPDIHLKAVMDYQKSLSGEAIEQQRIVDFDLTDLKVRKQFAYPELLTVLKSKKMVSVPIFNPWNPNHVRLVVSIFHSYDEMPVSNDELFYLGVAVGHSTSLALDEAGSTSVAKVNALVGGKSSVRDFAEGLSDIIEKAIDCEEVNVLLRNPIDDKFEPAGYKDDESVKGLEDYFSQFGNVRETVITPEGKNVAANGKAMCMNTPLLRSNGEVLGWVRCCNKHTPRKLGTSESFIFCDDDAAILEAIAQAAVPHFEVLIAQERRAKALGRLTHELKAPIVAIRGAVDFIEYNPEVKRLFEHDYLGDILEWTDLVDELLDNLDLLRHSLLKLPIKAKKTRLLADVVSPAVKQLDPTVRRYGFAPSRITRGRFEAVPPLYIDRKRFHQVFFNLLSNAIKYSYKDRNAFRIDIEGYFHAETGFKIVFRDWGKGVAKGEEKAIFQEGFRGSGITEEEVTGQGFGLWLVQQTVESHGGTIKLTNNLYPTEFTILLPKYLKFQAPKTQHIHRSNVS